MSEISKDIIGDAFKKWSEICAYTVEEKAFARQMEHLCEEGGATAFYAGFVACLQIKEAENKKLTSERDELKTVLVEVFGIIKGEYESREGKGSFEKLLVEIKQEGL